MPDTRKMYKELPHGLKIALPYIAIMASIGAFLYSWLVYTSTAASFPGYWPEAIQAVAHFILFTLAGILWVVSAIMFFAKKAAAWNTFVKGIFSVITALFINLILLIIVSIWRLFDGTVFDFVSNLGNPLTDPRNIVSIVVIVVIVALAIASKRSNDEKKIK